MSRRSPAPRAASLIVLTLSALALAGCSHSDSTQRGFFAYEPLSGATYGPSTSSTTGTGVDPPPSAVIASARASAQPPSATTSASGVDSDQQLASPYGAPVDDSAGHAAATAAALKAMTAFTRTDLPYASWYAQLSPLLSMTAAQAYTDTDPANIPAHSITGPAVYLSDPAETAYLARVTVPTNVGTYTVLLSRNGAGMGWLVERFTPPPGVGK